MNEADSTERVGDQMVNPITMAFDLVRGYQELLEKTLTENGLGESDIEHVLSNMDDLGVDNQLLFSLNRRYATDEAPFERFCREHLSEELFRVVYRSASQGRRIKHLYAHQAEGIRHITSGIDTVVATGTGSGKTETFLFPVLDHCLRHPGEGVKALIVYPMNALANDQLRRLGEMVGAARAEGLDLRYGSFTGLTPHNNTDAVKKGLPTTPQHDGHVVFRDDIRREPPDILITNYVMLDRMLTSGGEAGDRQIFERSALSLKFVVLDELHTYRGNNATHLRGLLRRLRHALKLRPVFVGTSATLTRGAAGSIDGFEAQPDDNYLTKAAQYEIDAFLKPLFDTESYEVVLPSYEPVLPPKQLQPVPCDIVAANLGWSLQYDMEEGLRNLSCILGSTYDDWDLASIDGAPPRATADLASNTFIAALADRLHQGPLSFREVVDELGRHMSEGSADPVDLGKAYLSAIAFVNQFAEGEALLDFRIHLFLKDLRGYLQLCVRCRRYHPGVQEVCGTCGWPLFKAHKGYVKEALGAVVGRELRRTFDDQEKDSGVQYLTRIAFDGEAAADLLGRKDATEPDRPVELDRLRFDGTAAPSSSGVPLTHSPQGALRIYLVPRDTYERPDECAVRLVSAWKNYQYLSNLVENMLRSQQGADRKLLAFVDNREKASRYVSILGDEFASDYYEDLLSLYRPALRMRSLPASVDFMIDELGEESLSEEEEALLQDFPAWVSRALGRSPRKDEDCNPDSLFALVPPPGAGADALESFSELQRAVLKLFFNERAIDKRFLASRVPELAGEAFAGGRGKGKLRAQRYLIGQHQGVQLGSEGSSKKRFSSVSLGELSRTYADFIQEHGLDAVHDSVRALVDDGTSPHLPLVAHCVSENSEDGAIHFYLKSSWVRFSPRDRGMASYGDVRERLLRGGLHTSDVLDEQRADVEAAFQDGRLDFLVATPTLEMGVDIGQLKSVLHIGVPPLPSSYAQRAGRAGRGRDDRYALIVTFCSDHSNHDRYYFDRPREMVAGFISPPSFDPSNPDVLQKHVHALVLRNWVENREAFQALVTRADSLLPSMAEEAREVFGDAFDAGAYVLGAFRDGLSELLYKVERARVQPFQLFFDINVFPDYGFRRDEVAVLDKKAADEHGVDLKAAARRFRDGVLDGKDHQTFDRLRVSGRDPEQAYYRLAPGETVSMAGDDFVIGSDSPFCESIGSEESGYAKSYRFLYGYRSEDLKKAGDAQQRDRETWRTPDPNAATRELGGIVCVAHHDKCRLSFRTHFDRGLQEPPSSDEVSGDLADGELVMGYDLEREALTFSLPKALFADDRLAISFLSAFDRAVKDAYGLDEGDLRLIVDIAERRPAVDLTPDASRQPANGGSDRQENLHAVLYDASGNGNAPLKRILLELTDAGGALQRAYERLSNCPNETCVRGCYLCTRTYSTHFYSGDVDRSAARMVVGYLLGENAFEPALPLPPDLVPQRTSVALRISLESGVARVEGADENVAVEPSISQNVALYEALARGAVTAFAEGSEGLRIVVDPGVGYLTRIINARRPGRKAKRSEQAAFERMMFNMLRYRTVRADDYGAL